MNRRQRRAAARKAKGRTPRRDQYFQQWAPVLPHLQPYAPVPDATCPDCGARFDQTAQEMTHEDGCPISAGYEAASADDREWFREHPDATTRRRTPTMGEIQQQMLMQGLELPDLNTDVRYEPGGGVVVNFLSDAVRVRNFSDSVLLVNFGHPSDGDGSP